MGTQPFFITFASNNNIMATQTIKVNNGRVLEINDWTNEEWASVINEKLMQLGPGQTAKVRVNPNQFHTVFRIVGRGETTVSSGNITKIGEHGIPAKPWTVRYGNKPYQVGLLNGYDVNGDPSFSRLSCNDKGEIVFNGDRFGDPDKFMAIQLHPQMRVDPLTGIQRKNWKWEVVNEEAESVGVTENFKKKLAVQNEIANLSDWQLNVLMSHETFERFFYGQPTLVNKPTAAQGYLIKQVETMPLKSITDRLALLKEVADIHLLKDGIAGNKIITTEKELSRYDGVEVAVYPEPINVSTHESKAIGIYKYCANLPEFKEKVIDFLKEEAGKLPTTSKKVK